MQCIGELELCNGNTKCNDESDENPDVCKGNKRLANQKYARNININFILTLYQPRENVLLQNVRPSKMDLNYS